MTALAVTESELGEALRVAALAVYIDELRATIPTLMPSEQAEIEAEIDAARNAARRLHGDA